MKIVNPPYDGGQPCPMCPVEIRNLLAVAHNYVNTKRGRSYERTTLEDLERAIALAQPFADEHFADKAHSHGRIAAEPSEQLDRG